jgi:single-strand DNA-binding protein
MASLNRTQLIGRLTRDPEMRYTSSGKPVTTFSVAVNRYATAADGSRKEETDFFNVVAWNQGSRTLAELVAQHLTKGSQVYVEGRLRNYEWDAPDGQKRKATEIVANDVQFLDAKREAAHPQPTGDLFQDFGSGAARFARADRS